MAMRNAGDDMVPVSSSDFDASDVPSAVDRRTFLMRSAVISAAAILTGRPVSAAQRTSGASAPPPKLPTTLSPDLYVVKQEKEPIITVLEEFYKVGP